MTVTTTPEAGHPRRDFLWKFGLGAGVAALAGQTVAALRSLVPNVSYDPPTTVRLGPPEAFPDGLTFRPDARLFVVRDGRSFHAISAVCTHLGCTVRPEALPRAETKPVDGVPVRLTHRFLCPCHGSRYDGAGTNLSGPAPRPLAWHPLFLAPDDGQLVVDLAREVGRDFRLTLA
jgi:cytochrome b6-f complex iron-sulfur subunit